MSATNVARAGKRGNICVRNNVSATLCPRLPPPLYIAQCVYLRWWQTRTQCCGHIVANTNVSLFARAGNICCGHKICVRDTNMFLTSFRNILRPQQMFPRLLAQENITSNNVSTTMCPRLPPPLRQTLPSGKGTESKTAVQLTLSP